MSFDEQYYLNNNPDVKAAVESGGFASALDHYNRHGAKEGRATSAQSAKQDFSYGETYLNQNKDVADAVAAGHFRDAQHHYQLHGAQEGREWYNGQLKGNAAQSYLQNNSDVLQAVNDGYFNSAWDHYKLHGESEGRSWGGDGTGSVGVATNGQFSGLGSSYDIVNDSITNDNQRYGGDIQLGQWGNYLAQNQDVFDWAQGETMQTGAASGSDYRNRLNSMAQTHWDHHGVNENRPGGPTIPANYSVLDGPFPDYFVDTQSLSLSENLNALMSRSNPLVQQARLRAAQMANGRGLLNSSLAVGQAEQAAFSAMLPVAQSETDAANQRWALGQEIASREKIANWNRQKALAQSVANNNSAYSQMFSNIVANPNYDAQTREDLFRHISFNLDQGNDFINQIYGTNLTWESAVVDTDDDHDNGSDSQTDGRSDGNDDDQNTSGQDDRGRD